jgi:hypothetical protein
MTAPGTTRTYYICPHNPNNPRRAAKNPHHTRAAFGDQVICDAVDEIIARLLRHDRAAMLATADAATTRAAQTDQLRHRFHQADTAINGLMTQLEQLGSDTAPAAASYRDRIREQFTAATTTRPPPKPNSTPSPPPTPPPPTRPS